MTIGWGIIGTGNYPDTSIAPAINQARDAKLIAVYSRDQGRGETFAAKHGAETAYTSIEDLLNDSRVDAVYIASPNHLHASHTELAANAGKHVMVEKPLSLHLDEGLQMVKICKTRSVKLGVGFQLRQHPGHIEARRLVAEGALGNIALAQAQLGRGTRGEVRPAPATGLREWWERPEMIGGALTMIGMGVHCVDDLHFILGQHVVEIAAITDGQTPEQPLENLATMCLRFSGGTIGTVCCGRRMPEFQNDVTIYGSKGKIVLADGSPPRLQGELRVSSETVTTTVAYKPDPVVLVTWQIEDFNRAVQEDRDPAASGIDGLKVVQVTVGMIESASSGRTIKLEPLPAGLF